MGWCRPEWPKERSAAAALELADQVLAEIDAALSATLSEALANPRPDWLFWGVGSMTDR